jgi:hypothetical protein
VLGLERLEQLRRVVIVHLRPSLAHRRWRRNRGRVHGERHRAAGEACEGSRQITRFVIYYALVTR